MPQINPFSAETALHNIREVDFESLEPIALTPAPPSHERGLFSWVCLDDIDLFRPLDIQSLLSTGTYPAPSKPVDEPVEPVEVHPEPVAWFLQEPLVPMAQRRRNQSKGRLHSGMLRGEVRHLYNAMSFKNLRDGYGFDTLITVTARYLGVEDEAEFARLIPTMNKAAAGWLGNGNDRPRQRRSARCRMTKSREHTYLYVLETGSKHGLHVHQLCSVPPELQANFRAWLRRWWETKVGQAVPDNAINVKFSHSVHAWSQYEKQAFWFRYLIKMIDPTMEVVSCRTQERRSAVEVFKPLWRWGMKPAVSLPIGCRQIYGMSQNLNTAAQGAFGFRSKFDAGRLDELYSGSETRAGAARRVGDKDWWLWL